MKRNARPLFATVCQPESLQERSAEDLLLEFRAEVQQVFDRIAERLVEDVQIELLGLSLNASWTSTPALAVASNGHRPQFKAGPPQTCPPATLSCKIGEQSEARLSMKSKDVDYVTWPNAAPTSSIVGGDVLSACDDQTAQPSLKRDSSSKVLSTWRHAIASAVTSTDMSLLNKIERLRKNHQEREILHRRFMYRCVFSKHVTFLCGFVIFANALWLGYECDHRAASESETASHKLVSLSFNVWFMVELALKIVVLKREFVLGPDRAWNILDVFFVLFSVPEFFSDSVNMSLLRIVRIGKLTKGLRLIRVLRFVTSLRLIMTTVFMTMESLLWSFVAIFFVAYMCSVLFQQALSIHMEDGAQFSSNTTDNFKSVWRSMLALFSCITGGQDWYGFVLDFEKQGAYSAEYVLLLWIFFTTFGLVNVVIAVFCARATQAKLKDVDLRATAQKETQSAKIKESMKTFRMIDIESRGFIVWDQFNEFATSPRGEAYLQSCGVQAFALQHLWSIMDGYDGAEDGKVDAIGFVMGFTRLSGESVNAELVLLSRKFSELRESIQASFHEIYSIIKGDEQGCNPNSASITSI